MTHLWRRLARHFGGGDATQAGDALRADFRWTYEPVAKSGGDSMFQDDGQAFAGDPPDDNQPGLTENRNAERASQRKREGSPLALAARRDKSAPAEREGPARQPAALAYLRHRLDEAAARWWATGELPPVELLRAGLTALEDGCELEAEHRSLLLRASLHHGRGMLTALGHQDDPERTGLVLAEALTAGEEPVPVEAIITLMDRDPHSRLWRPALLFELRAAANSVDSVRRARAGAALRQLASDETASGAEAAQTVVNPGVPARARRFAWKPRHTLWLLILVCVASAGVWAVIARGQQSLMVRLPAGEYALPLANNGGEPVTIQVDSFVIDRHEVTNRQYRACYGRGRCSWPASGDAAGIKDYFVNPAYDMYPVVNIDWDAAAEYCRAQGKRLPTEEEWLVAAAAAPMTGRLFTYPWGNVFGGGRANTKESGRGLPALVGSYSPAGDSPSGASEMAGNVAEWTATVAEGGAGRVVKGGSYRDDGPAAQASAFRIMAAGAVADWIGFRCAAD